MANRAEQAQIYATNVTLHHGETNTSLKIELCYSKNLYCVTSKMYNEPSTKHKFI